MRFTLVTLAAGALLIATGCSDLISLNSFAPENLAARNPALAGVWADKDDLFIVTEKDSGYAITVAPNGKSGDTASFTATLFRAGNAEILDLVPAGDPDGFHLATHTPVRIWVAERTLKFAYLDSKWLREQARRQLPVQDVGSRLLITAPAAAVANFLSLHAGDDRAIDGAPGELIRQ